MGTSKLTKTLFEKQVQTSPLEEGRIVWFSPKASFVGLEDLSRFVTILCHGALAFYSLAKPDASRLDSSFLVGDLVWVRVRSKPGTDPFECIPGHPCRWQSKFRSYLFGYQADTSILVGQRPGGSYLETKPPRLP